MYTNVLKCKMVRHLRDDDDSYYLPFVHTTQPCRSDNRLFSRFVVENTNANARGQFLNSVRDKQGQEGKGNETHKLEEKECQFVGLYCVQGSYTTPYVNINVWCSTRNGSGHWCCKNYIQ